MQPYVLREEGVKPFGRVAIVGGGLTGVSSAAHLVAHGFEVVIFEAEEVRSRCSLVELLPTPTSFTFPGDRRRLGEGEQLLVAPGVCRLYLDYHDTLITLIRSSTRSFTASTRPSFGAVAFRNVTRSSPRSSSSGNATTSSLAPASTFDLYAIVFARC